MPKPTRPHHAAEAAYLTDLHAEKWRGISARTVCAKYGILHITAGQGLRRLEVVHGLVSRMVRIEGDRSGRSEKVYYLPQYAPREEDMVAPKRKTPIKLSADAKATIPDGVKLTICPSPHLNSRYEFVPPSKHWKGQISRDQDERRGGAK